jgi:hypothetical protein
MVARTGALVESLLWLSVLASDVTQGIALEGWNDWTVVTEWS